MNTDHAAQQQQEQQQRAMPANLQTQQQQQQHQQPHGAQQQGQGSAGISPMTQFTYVDLLADSVDQGVLEDFDRMRASGSGSGSAVSGSGFNGFPSPSALFSASPSAASAPLRQSGGMVGFHAVSPGMMARALEGDGTAAPMSHRSSADSTNVASFPLVGSGPGKAAQLHTTTPEDSPKLPLLTSSGDATTASSQSFMTYGTPVSTTNSSAATAAFMAFQSPPANPQQIGIQPPQQASWAAQSQYYQYGGYQQQPQQHMIHQQQVDAQQQQHHYTGLSFDGQSQVQYLPTPPMQSLQQVPHFDENGMPVVSHQQQAGAGGAARAPRRRTTTPGVSREANRKTYTCPHEVDGAPCGRTFKR